MGDAGEGLVDAESRLAERMEEREQERRIAKQGAKGIDPERVRQMESLRLARTEMQRQMESTAHDARKKQLAQAIAEIDKRLAALSK
jgi:NADH:ubiquinone oxidoreductase subunit D